VLKDEIGLTLAAPDPNWRSRPDMHPAYTRRARASLVARSRFIEDLVIDSGVSQYVILGAGLDSFALRNPELGPRLRVFEVDTPHAQAWKRRRFAELGWELPQGLQLVSANFSADASWLDALLAAGFDARTPAVVAAAGLSTYLTREAIDGILRSVAQLASGSVLAMTFQLPLEDTEPAERAEREQSERGARAAGTPFISFFTPQQLSTAAREAGFHHVQHISARTLTERYFLERSDGLHPSSAEELLLARA
jgi:methyltransferase (TIGR00027 family)